MPLHLAGGLPTHEMTTTTQWIKFERNNHTITYVHYGPSPPDLNKNRVLTLKLAARCGSRVFKVQPSLVKGLGVGLISGSSLPKYLLDLAIMIAKNVAPRHKQFRETVLA